MNSFSINRFWLMLRWLINVNRVRLLGFTVGIMFSTFLIQLIMFVFGSFEKVIPYLWSCVHFGSFLILVHLEQGPVRLYRQLHPGKCKIAES